MQEFDYNNSDFEMIYTEILNRLTADKKSSKKHCSILLNGLPGSGKSYYSKTNLQLDNYITINADDFRAFHPRIEEIEKLDVENYTERTQPFINRVTEKLLSDLSSLRYNLIVEGTLRTVEVPAKTYDLLKNNNYIVDLIIVACNAETAWESTIARANQMIDLHQKPRLIPIDKFDYNVNHIVENLNELISSQCFDNIKIINRDGYVLNNDCKDAAEALSRELKIENWNFKKEKFALDFLKLKSEILKREIDELEKH